MSSPVQPRGTVLFPPYRNSYAMTDKPTPEEILADPQRDLSLKPATANHSPDASYATSNRKWQGIPGIERTTNGRLFATWYSGGEGEGPDNFVLLVQSDDDGKTWSGPTSVIDPPGKVRAYDPCLWIDPQGRLWLFWAQSFMWWDGRSGTWAIRCDEPDASKLEWTEPRRVCDGIMMNKPTVTRAGDWLLPTAVWTCTKVHDPAMVDQEFSNVTINRDSGETFAHLGSADIPERGFDEHMVVEKNNGDLWMLVRRKDGVGESLSTDNGKTWSPGALAPIAGPDSRFFIRRLASGNLLLINHIDFKDAKNKRTNLTALLSTDDGQTWQGGLLLDGRESVSYPDATQAPDGSIYAIHDHSRHGEMQILMSVFTEEDILAGKLVSKQSRLAVMVDQKSD